MSPSYEHDYSVINDAYINYPVMVDTQLYWCESGKHQLCQIESAFSPARELEMATLWDLCHKFTFVLS